MDSKQHKYIRKPESCGKLHFLFIIILFFLVWMCYRTSEMKTKISRVVMPSLQGKKVVNYVIQTPNCRIPKTKLFTEDVKAFFKRNQYLPCSTLDPLVYVKRDAHDNILFINYTNSKLYTSSKFECCYSPIKRKIFVDNPDDYIDILDCVPFETNTTVSDDTIRVYCYNDYSNHIIYENVYSLFSLDEVKIRTQIPSKNSKLLSLLLFGIDSMSTNNLMRTMPKTYNYLFENDWIRLKGYNKIGENTFPNLMGILTGMNDSYAYKVCSPEALGNLDKCDLIWYKYRKLGIITAYGEDVPHVSTFNYGKMGFLNPPTDVYLRPYFIAAETLNVSHNVGLRYCAGPISSAERIYSAVIDFALGARGYPSFGFFWTNSFSHEDMNFPSGMDGKTEEFLMHLEENSILENTIVVFFSDHGFRFGDFRLTYTGWLEERLPFIYFWIPKWFRKKFHKEYKNLLTNSERLTTPYELHMTLQHLLELFGYDYQQKPSSACPKCKSLFLEADLDRTCEDAAVEECWCTCKGYLDLDVSHPKVIAASKFALEHILKHLATNYPEESKKCSAFALKNVRTARIGEEYVNKEIKNVSYLTIIFNTVPYAVFEATVEVAGDKDYEFSINGDISRLDRYREDSYCTNVTLLKKYCYCRSFVSDIKAYLCNIFPCS